MKHASPDSYQLASASWLANGSLFAHVGFGEMQVVLDVTDDLDNMSGLMTTSTTGDPCAEPVVLNLYEDAIYMNGKRFRAPLGSLLGHLVSVGPPMSVDAAAKELGLRKGDIVRLVNDGRLISHTSGNSRLISAASVLREKGVPLDIHKPAGSITKEEAAEILGLDPGTVIKLALKGKVKQTVKGTKGGVKPRRTSMYDRDSVLAYLDQRGPRKKRVKPEPVAKPSVQDVPEPAIEAESEPVASPRVKPAPTPRAAVQAAVPTSIVHQLDGYAKGKEDMVLSMYVKLLADALGVRL